jgi:hypothetical protein
MYGPSLSSENLIAFPLFGHFLRQWEESNINALEETQIVLLKKLTAAQLVKKFSSFFEKINFRVHKSPSLSSILSQMNEIHTLTSYLPTIHLNVALFIYV